VQYISIQKAIQSLVLDPEFTEVFPAPSKFVRSNEKFTVFTRIIKIEHIFKKTDCPRKQWTSIMNCIYTFFLTQIIWAMECELVHLAAQKVLFNFLKYGSKIECSIGKQISYCNL
jgi:hypothetical protein